MPLYMVVWQNLLGVHVSLKITTVFALLKPLVSPTYAKFGRTCDISYSICKKSGLLKVPIL